MRALLVAVLLTACGGDDSTTPEQALYGDDGKPTGPVQESCAQFAVTWCQGHDRKAINPNTGVPYYDGCLFGAYRAACREIGSAPSAGCANGGICVRSSVDFNACDAAVIALGSVVGCSRDPIDSAPDCVPIPAECKSAACMTAAEGCAEDPGKDD